MAGEFDGLAVFLFPSGFIKPGYSLAMLPHRFLSWPVTGHRITRNAAVQDCRLGSGDLDNALPYRKKLVRSLS
jgi:hypothetical protein